MKMKIFICILMAISLSLPALSLQDTLVSAVKELYNKSSAPIVVTFGTFTYGDKKMGSNFSRYLENQLTVSIGSIPFIELFARDSLEEILEAQELNLSGMFSQDDIPEIGGLKGIKGILSGRFYDNDKDVELFLDLVKIETGTFYGNTRIRVPKSALPKNISLLPDNYTQALEAYESLEDIDSKEDAGELTIDLWCKRGNGGTYVDKEELILHFFADEDCFIKIYHIGANGEVALIFPNIYHENNFIKKNKVYTIPAENYEFSFELGPPFGTEFIKVVASLNQFADIEEAFAPLGKSAPEVISRGLTVKQRKAALAEAMLSYTIVAE